MRKNTVTSKDDFFHQLKCHMVGMSKEAWGENGDRVVVSAVEERCKTIAPLPPILSPPPLKII